MLGRSSAQSRRPQGPWFRSESHRGPELMSAPFSDEDLAHVHQLLKIKAELNELVAGLRAHMAAKSDYAEPMALIAEFLGKVGHLDLASYLVRHAVALFDLRYGITDPSLDLKKDRSWQDATIRMRGRQWVSLAYDCFRTAGMSHPQVSKAIKKHPDLKKLLRGKNASLETSPKSWHDQFMDKQITNSAAQQGFNCTYRA